MGYYISGISLVYLSYVSLVYLKYITGIFLIRHEKRCRRTDTVWGNFLGLGKLLLRFCAVSSC